MNTKLQSTGFVCPECREQLQKDSDKYSCQNCNRIWLTDHGIPRFSENELFWSVFDSNIAEKVATQAENDSWENAITAYEHTLSKYTRGYIRNEARADWHIILPITPDSVVVDIGSGWGNIALGVAKRCGHLYCGDVNMKNLRLLRCRLRDAGLDHVDPFLYDANQFLRLPFQDKSVDAVLLNGVMEWMGNIDHPASPERIQLEALKEIHRVLKDDGVLYVGIENRYSVGTLRGKGLHGELPFVGLLPRWLSNAITKLVRNEPHRTYIYSLNGYHRLLRRAEYNNIDSYWPYPSYHDPNYLIPLNPGWVKRFWLNSVMVSRSNKFKLVRMLGLHFLPFHWVAFSFGFRCRK